MYYKTTAFYRAAALFHFYHTNKIVAGQYVMHGWIVHRQDDD